MLDLREVNLCKTIIERVNFKEMDHKVMKNLDSYERKRLIHAWRNDYQHTTPSVVINGFMKMDVSKIRLKADKHISTELLEKIMNAKMNGMIKNDAIEAYRYGLNESWKKKQRNKTPELRERKIDRQTYLYKTLMLGERINDHSLETGMNTNETVNELCAE